MDDKSDQSQLSQLPSLLPLDLIGPVWLRVSRAPSPFQLPSLLPFDLTPGCLRLRVSRQCASSYVSSFALLLARALIQNRAGTQTAGTTQCQLDLDATNLGKRRRSISNGAVPVDNRLPRRCHAPIKLPLAGVSFRSTSHPARQRRRTAQNVLSPAPAQPVSNSQPVRQRPAAVARLPWRDRSRNFRGPRTTTVGEIRRSDHLATPDVVDRFVKERMTCM